MPAGRPLKFKTPQEMQKKIDEYFASRYNESGELVKPISITGLALHLDCYRETLTNYQERDEFFDTVKKAKLRVENFYEERLPLSNATGCIFALKNFDWTDKQDVNLGGQSGNPVKTETSLNEADRNLFQQWLNREGYKK